VWQRPDGACGKKVVAGEDSVGRVAQLQQLTHRLGAGLAVKPLGEDDEPPVRRQAGDRKPLGRGTWPVAGLLDTADTQHL
jgi:hypothetical protein